MIEIGNHSPNLKCLLIEILCSKAYQSLHHVSTQALIVRHVLLVPAGTGIVRLCPCLVTLVPFVPAAGRSGVGRGGRVAVGPLPSLVLLSCSLLFLDHVPGLVHALRLEF